MKKLNNYSIPFKGLNDGVHQFEFRLGGAFFEEFGNEDLADADLEVDLKLTKEPSFMEVEFQIAGTFKTSCDRCLGELVIPIESDRKMIAKVHEPTDDEDIIALGPQDTVLQLAYPFYEAVVVELPLKRAHVDEDACDPEVMDRLETLTKHDPEENDPRWDALKKLSGKN